jgi:hypothetical protein
MQVTQKEQRAEKISNFPCKSPKFQAFRTAIFFDILTHFSIPYDIFGHSLDTVLLPLAALADHPIPPQAGFQEYLPVGDLPAIFFRYFFHGGRYADDIQLIGNEGAASYRPSLVNKWLLTGLVFSFILLQDSKMGILRQQFSRKNGRRQKANSYRAREN